MTEQQNVTEVDDTEAQEEAFLGSPTGGDILATGAFFHAAPKQTPTIGRIVHYCLSSGRTLGEWRPGIITRVNEDGSVNLQVFMDARSDPFSSPYPIVQVTEGENPGNYRWPPYVAPVAVAPTQS